MAEISDVLVVDDDRLVKGLVKEWVEETGRETFLAENAVSALQVLKLNPTIQVLVTDIRLPVMDGNELIREALKLRPDLKVVVMTGYAQEIDTPEKFPIIEKPFESFELIDVLTQVCGKGAPN